MRHRKAKRLLSALPDETLPVMTEIEVRAHVEHCRRCTGRLADLEHAEDLVRRLPAALFPVEAEPPREYRRLAALARWSDEPDLPEPDGWRAPVLSIVGFITCVLLAAVIGESSPRIDISHDAPLIMATSLPDSSYLPGGWTASRF